MHLLATIERHLHETGTPPSRFGRQVLGDPRFVHDIRRGRVPGPRTRQRIGVYLGFGGEPVA